MCAAVANIHLIRIQMLNIRQQVRALAFTEMRVLSRGSFMKAAVSFPDMQKRIAACFDERLSDRPDAVQEQKHRPRAVSSPGSTSSPVATCRVVQLGSGNGSPKNGFQSQRNRDDLQDRRQVLGANARVGPARQEEGMKKISPAPPVLDEKPRELVDSNQHAVNNANQQVAPIPISPDALGALLIKIVSQQDSQQAQLDALGKTQHDLLLAIGRIEHGTLRKLSSEMTRKKTCYSPSNRSSTNSAKHNKKC